MNPTHALLDELALKIFSSSPSALSEDSTSFSQCDEKEKRSGVGPPVERETGRLNLTRNPSYRPARHPTTPLGSDSQGRYPLKRANSRIQFFYVHELFRSFNQWRILNQKIGVQ